MKFDIIMPTFKRQHCIDNTIKTILGQTHQDWSLIIVDNDGSQPYSFEDPRIKCFVHRERQSAAYARNRGVRYASGDVICFFDDDDSMHPEYLTSIVEAFHQYPKAKMVTVKMDANAERPRLRYATPCCAVKREFVQALWANVGQLQDQRYFKGMIRKNRWIQGRDIQHVDKVLVFVGHSPEGGLRHERGNF